MVKQSKTPIVNINGKGINSTSSNMNRNSSNAETSNNFSWMKRFLKINANNSLIFNKQQMSTIVLLCSSIAIASLFIAINKTNDSNFLTNSNVTTTTTTKMPDLINEVNVTTTFIIANNVTNYDESSSLQSLSSCSCANGTKYFYPNQSKDLSDWTIQAALKVCNGYNSSDCICEDMCICGEDNSCYSLLPNNEGHAKFYPHCTEDGSCHMYTMFEANSSWNFVNEQGSNPPDTGADESFGPHSNFFKAVSVSCNGCEVIREDICDC